MTDREKVRTQLAEIGIGLDMAGYHNDAQCVRDALALLREQEPVRPKREDAGHRIIMLCGACGAPIPTPGGWRYKYCPTCGRGIKWGCDE